MGELSLLKRDLGTSVLIKKQLIDSMRYYQFGLKSALKLTDALAPLPSDLLWEANDASEWATGYDSNHGKFRENALRQEQH